MLTGATRHRLNWRHKLILQVAEWRRQSLPGQAPWRDKYVAVWRDATHEDLFDIERGNFSTSAPKVTGFPLPPAPKSKAPSKPDTSMWDVAARAEPPEPGRIEYRFHGVTGEEEA